MSAGVCVECRAERAAFHVSQGVAIRLPLCHVCAQQRVPSDVLAFLDSLAGTTEPALASGVGAHAAGDECPRCGLAFWQLAETGMAGCPACYRQFDAAIGSALRSFVSRRTPSAADG